MINFLKTAFCLLLLFVFTTTLTAQAKKTRRPAKPEPEAAATPKATPQTPTADTPKTNKRPKDTPQAVNPKATAPTYFYEFTRPGFSYGRVLIDHDEAGQGKISFLKDGFDDMLTDPVELSPVTLTKINDALTALNFFGSTEDYQYERDYSHMGNTVLRVKKDGRERTVKFNWTTNKDAKILMDEYRRVANEYTWRFEITVARENQPLQTPGLMDAIDSYLKRSEISDPTHLLPFLKQLSTDEHLPLMARNHATNLIKGIEKEKK